MSIWGPLGLKSLHKSDLDKSAQTRGSGSNIYADYHEQIAQSIADSQRDILNRLRLSDFTTTNRFTTRRCESC
eukprot:UN08569